MAKKATARKVKRYFQKSKFESQKWLKIFTKEAKSTASRDYFPIIALEETHNDIVKAYVHDGNRRMALSIIQGKNTIAAFVGKYTSDEKTPKNFWLPTSFLMDLVYNAKISNNYESVLLFLKNLIKLSKSAEFELKERALIGKSEFRMRLKKDLE